MITGVLMRGSYGRPRHAPQGGTVRAVRTIAAVWDPDPETLDVLARQGALVHRAVDDQGPYARGSPFAAFVVGAADLELATGAGARLWAWRADQRVPRRSDGDCAVAMVSLMRRRPGASVHDFVTHWTERHTPLALRRHVGLADYHQFVVRQTLTPGTPEIDGIAMLGFLDACRLRDALLRLGRGAGGDHGRRGALHGPTRPRDDARRAPGPCARSRIDCPGCRNQDLTGDP